MQTIKLFLVILAFTASLSARAAEVWNYTIESNGPIQGGRLKISALAQKPAYITVKMKYKLETSRGYQEDWFPYNLPTEVFDGKFLSNLSPGSARNLATLPHGWESRTVKFRIKRESQNAFLLSFDDGSIRFYPSAGGGAWKRVELNLPRGIITLRMHGNLRDITRE